MWRSPASLVKYETKNRVRHDISIFRMNPTNQAIVNAQNDAKSNDPRRGTAYVETIVRDVTRWSLLGLSALALSGCGNAYEHLTMGE